MYVYQTNLEAIRCICRTSQQYQRSSSMTATKNTIFGLSTSYTSLTNQVSVNECDFFSSVIFIAISLTFHAMHTMFACLFDIFIARLFSSTRVLVSRLQGANGRRKENTHTHTPPMMYSINKISFTQTCASSFQWMMKFPLRRRAFIALFSLF